VGHTIMVLTCMHVAQIIIWSSNLYAGGAYDHGPDLYAGGAYNHGPDLYARGADNHMVL
jgi:hypothetical protein